MNLEKSLCELGNGNETAFDIIYQETSKAVFHIILSVLRNRAQAEDCMQEVYMTIFYKASQYQTGTNPKAWICTIAKNTALNFYKKNQREICYDIVDYSDIFVSKDTLENREEIHLIRAALKELPAEDYQIVMLCEVAGYKRREVAKILDMPIGTVTWKRNNALKILKTYLEKNS